MVVKAETLTRLLIRPRTPKQGVFCYKSKMKTNKKEAQQGKSGKALSLLRVKFEQEKVCKECAYDFIKSCGLWELYLKADWCSIPIKGDYMKLLIKSFSEFLNEEVHGFAFTEERFKEKIKAARVLYSKELKEMGASMTKPKKY